MSASIRSLRKHHKQRRRVTLELRVPNAMAQWLMSMTTVQREHVLAVAIKKYIKAPPKPTPTLMAAIKGERE